MKNKVVYKEDNSMLSDGSQRKLGMKYYHFLKVFLIVFGILLFIRDIGSVIKYINGEWHFSYLEAVYIADYILIFLFGFFLVYAGIQLWKKTINAPRLTIATFYIYLISKVIIYCLLGDAIGKGPHYYFTQIILIAIILIYAFVRPTQKYLKKRDFFFGN